MNTVDEGGDLKLETNDWMLVVFERRREDTVYTQRCFGAESTAALRNVSRDSLMLHLWQKKIRLKHTHTHTYIKVSASPDKPILIGDHVTG